METDQGCCVYILEMACDAAEACGEPSPYIFSRGFKPGSRKVNSEIYTCWWKAHVKEELGFTADFYSLKHSNISKTVDHLDTAVSAKMNGHISTAMVVQIYDVKKLDHEREQLRKVNNPFA